MRPQLSSLNLWRRHEERVCEVLAEALKLLQDTPDLEPDENEINRKLHFCIREANHNFSTQGRGVNVPIVSEARNQPSSRNRIKKVPREDKRPDFQWGFRDLSESDPQKQDKFFCIECKRLGKAPNPNWILNENYVKHGIVRFLEEEHGYAQEVDSGAMVGFIESSDFPLILQEVNSTLGAFQQNISQLYSVNGTSHSVECTRLEHAFERPFPISPFTLKHFWIDLRNKIKPPKKKAKRTKSVSSKKH